MAFIQQKVRIQCWSLKPSCSVISFWRSQSWRCPTNSWCRFWTVLPQLRGLWRNQKLQRPANTCNYARFFWRDFHRTHRGGQLNFLWGWWPTKIQDLSPHYHGLLQLEPQTEFRWISQHHLPVWLRPWYFGLGLDSSFSWEKNLSNFYQKVFDNRYNNNSFWLQTQS